MIFILYYILLYISMTTKPEKITQNITRHFRIFIFLPRMRDAQT